MLIKGSSLIGTPILNLHLGGKIATVTTCIIDPDNLKIIAFLIDGPIINSDTGDVLDIRSIREFSPLGFVIDSTDSISKREDIIRVKQIIDLDFILLNLRVKTKSGQKLGKITDFITNNQNFTVQQLVVQRPALHSLMDPELIIHRNQIVEINDEEVIVKDATKTSPRTTTQDAPNTQFVNPFRKPDFSTSDNQSPGAPNTE